MPYYAAISRLVQTAVAAVAGLERTEQDRLPYLGLPYLTPTIVRAPAQGEAQLNVLRVTACAALDVRTVLGQDHAALFGRLEELTRNAQGPAQLTLTLLEDRPWTQTAPDDPLVRALERAYPLVLHTRRVMAASRARPTVPF